MDRLAGVAPDHEKRRTAIDTVVGIFSNGDGVSALAHSMKASGFDINRLTVISNEAPGGYLASIGARFAQALEPTPVIDDSGHVRLNLPGLRTPNPFEYGAQNSSPAEEALSDLSVPDGRTDDFLTAVDAGRWVVGYPAGDAVDAVKSLFTQAGATRVVVF